jgi:NOL1/NOP2/fmu family ribosome biogenesis protein
MRWLTDDEAKKLVRFLDGFEDALGARIIGEKELAIDDDGNVSLCSQDLRVLPDEFLAETPHMGLRIGQLTRMGFTLDLQGAVLLGTYTRKQCIKVTDKASHLFQYGRAIFGDSIKNYDPRLNRGDACIVCNQRWEPIGLGRVLGRFKGNHPAVDPIHDLGSYLRDQ